VNWEGAIILITHEAGFYEDFISKDDVIKINKK
jgi:hypothetical protein